MKFEVAIATLENLLKMAALNKRLNKRDMAKEAKSFELCTNIYLMYLCEMTGAK